jgi:hypothetical protein
MAAGRQNKNLTGVPGKHPPHGEVLDCAIEPLVERKRRAARSDVAKDA